MQSTDQRVQNRLETEGSPVGRRVLQHNAVYRTGTIIGWIQGQNCLVLVRWDDHKATWHDLRDVVDL